MARLSLVLVLLTFAAHATPAQAARGARLWDPSGRALRTFHRALARTDRGFGQTRILQYGASHTEADIFTGYLREFFQNRFGDAGHGFVMPARPWRGYRHLDVQVDSSAGWFTDKAYRKSGRKDGLYGLAGFSCSAGDNAQWAWVGTSTKSAFGRRVSRFQVFFLKQPGGGRFDIKVDGSHYATLASNASQTTLGVRTIRVPDGPHELEVRPRGDGEVRLFGVVMERTTPGVVVDSLGIRGARASVQLAWDEPLWRESIQQRHPDLVILAYGTNEAGDTRYPIKKSAAKLNRVLDRLRSALPKASCVLVGPTDRPIKRHGKVHHRPRTDDVIRIQRMAAKRHRCAFWDSAKAMGGPLSIVKWRAQKPPRAQKDLVHLTRIGYQTLADQLAHSLLVGYHRR